MRYRKETIPISRNWAALGVLVVLFTSLCSAAQDSSDSTVKKGDWRTVEAYQGRYIVQFSEAPMASSKSLARKEAGSQKRALKGVHDQFSSDLAGIRSRSSGKRISPKSIKVEHEYFTVLNGVALALDANELEAVANLRYVSGIYPDQEGHYLLSKNVPHVGAPQVWEELGVTGKGIVVSVVDSGIDYTHPDLGGTFGRGGKVIGGYDIYDDDPDPMDYDGHGTHCAGIIAANGTLKGVAPDAKLVAFKVGGIDPRTGKEGVSMAAAAIGIELSVDPNQDGRSDDAVDVISISLGTKPAKQDAPWCQAVVNATAAGVVCVVAAGNEGEEGYEDEVTEDTVGTVRAPGCVSQALTVGATDINDRVAEFSSRGPAVATLGIKPDICAPGVEIVSLKPGGGAEIMSGTSMAAPFVAGAAALLRQLHPEWSPARIKAVLTATAVPLASDDVITRGAGRLDLAAAVRSQAVIEPGVIDLGNAKTNGRAPMWQASRTLTFTNIGSVRTGTDFGIDPIGLPAGVATSILPATVTLDAGQTASLTLQVAVDTSAIADLEDPPWLYEGAVTYQSATDSGRIPFAFSKSSQAVADPVPPTPTPEPAPPAPEPSLPTPGPSPPVDGGARRHALLVGVNRYLHMAERNLRGCENDVSVMRQMLIEVFRFDPKYVHTLLNEEATASSIISAFEEKLIRNSKPGDLVLFFFSGHGSQVPDASGDEPDGRDEILCPSDLKPSGRGNKANAILDDMLRALVERLPDREVIMILDCCHAGTGIRSVLAAGTPRFIPFDEPAHVDAESLLDGERTPAARGIGYRADGVYGDSLPATHAGGVVLVAACRSNETAQETKIVIGGREKVQGALTFKVKQVLDNTSVGVLNEPFTYGDLRHVLAAPLQTATFIQHPQVECEPSMLGRQIMLAGPAGSEPPHQPPAPIETTPAEIRPLRVFVAPYKVFFKEKNGKSRDAQRFLEASLGREPSIELVQAREDSDIAVFHGSSKRAVAGVKFVVGILAPSGEVTLRLPINDLAEDSLLPLVKELNRLYLVENLLRIRSRRSNVDLQIRLAAGGHGLSLGSELEFEIRSAKEGYLTVFSIDCEGNLHELVPNGYKGFQPFRVSAGQTLTIPNEYFALGGGQVLAMEVQRPVGQEFIKAMVTERPLALEAFGHKAADVGLRSITDVTSAGNAVSELGRAVGLVVQQSKPPQDGSGSRPPADILDELATGRFVDASLPFRTYD